MRALSIQVLIPFIQPRGDGMEEYISQLTQSEIYPSYLNVQARFRKGRGTRDQIANIYWIIKKAREFQKNIYLCFIDYAKAFDCVDHKNCGKF